MGVTLVILCTSLGLVIVASAKKEFHLRRLAHSSVLADDSRDALMLW